MTVKNLNFYVQSIYEIGDEEKQLNHYLVNAKFVLNLYKIDKSFHFFFKNSIVKKEEKRTLLEKYLPHKSDYFINFLLLILDVMTRTQIIIVLEKFIKKYNDKHQIKNGIIYSFEELNVSKIKDLQDLFKNKLKNEVFFENKIDKELLGGMKIIIDNQVWDYSVKNNLLKLTEELVGKGV